MYKNFLKFGFFNISMKNLYSNKLETVAQKLHNVGGVKMNKS